MSLPFDIEHPGFLTLLQGRHPELEQRANHAAVALWFALLFTHGFEQMRNGLTAD